MTKDRISIKASGEVTVSLVMGNDTIPIAVFHNDLQNTGLSVMAKALCESSYINYMYLLYTNAGEAPAFDPSAGTMDAEELRDITSSKGYVRVPLISASLADAVFTVSSITTAAGSAGEALTDSLSKFYAVGLIMAPNPLSAATDILFSAAGFKTLAGTPFTITKIANAQIGVSWQVTISNGEVTETTNVA